MLFGNRRPRSVLTDSPVVRSTGPRVLFLAGSLVTIAIFLWMEHLRLSGDLNGLTLIFFVLFTSGDHGATICMLLILMLAVFIPMQSPLRGIFRWAGEHPLSIPAISLL